MPRDKQYDLMFNLEDSGYQGLGEPGDNPISYLIDQPSSPGEFLKMNKDILDEGRMGILSMALNAFQNPFSSLYNEGENDIEPFDFDEEDYLNLNYEEDDIGVEELPELDPTKNMFGGEKVKRKTTTSGGSYGGFNPRY